MITDFIESWKKSIVLHLLTHQTPYYLDPLVSLSLSLNIRI